MSHGGSRWLDYVPRRGDGWDMYHTGRDEMVGTRATQGEVSWLGRATEGEMVGLCAV
jgi:hypothetical protein